MVFLFEFIFPPLDINFLTAKCTEYKKLIKVMGSLCSVNHRVTTIAQLLLNSDCNYHKIFCHEHWLGSFHAS